MRTVAGAPHTGPLGLSQLWCLASSLSLIVFTFVVVLEFVFLSYLVLINYLVEEDADISLSPNSP